MCAAGAPARLRFPVDQSKYVPILPETTPNEVLTAVLRDVLTVILPAYPELDDPTRGAVLGDVTRYVAAQVESMPPFLRLPYRLALVALEWLPLLRYGRRFSALPPATQAAYMARWNDAPIPAVRDFVKLIRSTALLVYFDHPVILQRLENERTR